LGPGHHPEYRGAPRDVFREQRCHVQDARAGGTWREYLDRTPARLIGSIAHDVASLLKVLARYGEPGAVQMVYEARPMGYGLQRALARRGYHCRVIAPSLIPKRSGDRFKTDRRDGLSLAEFARAGELRAVWIVIRPTRRFATWPVPSPSHESIAPAPDLPGYLSDRLTTANRSQRVVATRIDFDHFEAGLYFGAVVRDSIIRCRIAPSISMFARVTPTLKKTPR